MSESSELPSPVLPLNAGQSAVSSSWLNYCLWLFVLLILVVGSYWPSMHGGFSWDDDYYVTNNKALSRPGGMEQIWLGVTSPARTYPVPQFYPMTHNQFLARNSFAMTGYEPLPKSGPFICPMSCSISASALDALDDPPGG